MDKLDEVSWPVSRIGEVIEALARTGGLSPKPVETPTFPEGLAQDSDEALGRWIETAAGYLGLEAEPVETSYAEVERLVSGAGPALLCLPSEGEVRFLALVGSRRRAVYILGPDRAVHRFRPEVICTALCQDLERQLATGVDWLLVEAGIRTQRRARVREAILREHLRPARIGGCWLLRLAPGASVWQHIRQARLPQRLAVLISAHTAQYLRRSSPGG